jgi:hypothetical protein
MSDFVVRPIAAALADQVRATQRSPQYGHPAHREIAKGTGPCRLCLAPFTVGSDERILFTYNPFADGQTPQPGPVFIHANECTAFEGSHFPEELSALPLLVEAHFDDGHRSDARSFDHATAYETIDALLRDSRVSFLHLRHGEAGCFIARVERKTA